MKVAAVALGFALLLQAQSKPDVLSETAKELAMQKRFEEAANLWNQALGLSGSHFPSLFNFGYMRYSLAQYPEAEVLLRRAARRRPGDFNTRYLLGSTLMLLDKREEALREWRAALVLQPDNRKLMQIMAVEYSKGRYFQESCAVARRAIDWQQVDAVLVAVKACQDAGDAGVLELTSKAVVGFPESPRVNFEHGFQLRKAGRSKEGLAYIAKAVEADPKYEEPFFVYGEILLEQERYGEAADQLRKALQIRPDYLAACTSLAKAFIGAQKDEEAIRELRRCIELGPTNPQPHLLLSQIYFRLGDEQKAQLAKERSLQLRSAPSGVMEAPQSRKFPAGLGK